MKDKNLPDPALFTQRNHLQQVYGDAGIHSPRAKTVLSNGDLNIATGVISFSVSGGLFL